MLLIQSSILKMEDDMTAIPERQDSLHARVGSNAPLIPPNMSVPENKANLQPESKDSTDFAPIFARIWPIAAADSNLTMYGFRRFKTSHLLNLRFLEHEIEKLDRDLYQAGMNLDYPMSSTNRLGLSGSVRDPDAKDASEVVTQESVLRLRSLVQEYDDTLVRFNQVMQMETFALSDDTWHSAFRNELNEWESFKTRLVRVDLPSGKVRSPLENGLSHVMRTAWRKWKLRQESERQADSEQQGTNSPSYNIIRVNFLVIRFLVALSAAGLLVIPLILLSDQKNDPLDLLTISLFIVLFCFAVNFCTGSSALATMGATEAYAAVLVVFLSNNS